MTSITRYRGDISRLVGAHIVTVAGHTFYASTEGALDGAHAIDEGMVAAGVDIYADDFEFPYALDVCPPACPLRAGTIVLE
jgi:hypothetical protein